MRAVIVRGVAGPPHRANGREPPGWHGELSRPRSWRPPPPGGAPREPPPPPPPPPPPGSPDAGEVEVSGHLHSGRPPLGLRTAGAPHTTPSALQGAWPPAGPQPWREEEKRRGQKKCFPQRGHSRLLDLKVRPL
ncbi:hypothetical protein VULLAG_LOCUS14089 [Vulpes lagopus]